MEDFWKLFNPESIVELGGLALLLFVVFAETGLLIGFFLPGDSLIFIAGITCVSRPEIFAVNLFVLIVLLCIAAILGNVAGYWFGRKVGPALFNKKDSWIFKKQYLITTKEFYDKNGGKTLIIGRFLPVIRTFAPILSGVIRMEFGIFMLYNIVGAVAWIGSLCSAGYYLGKFEWVKDNIGLIVIALVVITLIPLISTYLRSKFKRHR
jgi:membrane-associated protein